MSVVVIFLLAQVIRLSRSSRYPLNVWCIESMAQLQGISLMLFMESES